MLSLQADCSEICPTTFGLANLTPRLFVVWGGRRETVAAGGGAGGGGGVLLLHCTGGSNVTLDRSRSPARSPATPTYSQPEHWGQTTSYYQSTAVFLQYLGRLTLGQDSN